MVQATIAHSTTAASLQDLVAPYLECSEISETISLRVRRALATTGLTNVRLGRFPARSPRLTTGRITLLKTFQAGIGYLGPILALKCRLDWFPRAIVGKIWTCLPLKCHLPGGCSKGRICLVTSSSHHSSSKVSGAADWVVAVIMFLEWSSRQEARLRTCLMRVIFQRRSRSSCWRRCFRRFRSFKIKLAR